jgi:hypothetical protein
LIVRTVCELVGKRAARLSAAGVAAIVTKINRLDGCTVAVDGSLFELYPHFANRMRDALRELLGMSSENVVLEQGMVSLAKFFFFFFYFSSRLDLTMYPLVCLSHNILQPVTVQVKVLP